jgi:hypothetical protein
MQNQFESLIKLRIRTRELVKGLSNEQLLAIPGGFRNNILWNAGHLVVTAELLTYSRTGHKPTTPMDLVERYRKGSDGSQVRIEDLPLIEERLLESPFQLQRDYESGLFSSFERYRTSLDVELGTIEDAIAFNGIHEGMHIGFMKALARIVA